MGLMCILKKTGKPFILITTHLDPTNENNAQLTQLSQLSHFIDSFAPMCSSGAVPLILAGDFNIPSSSSLYPRLLALISTHATDMTHTPEPTYTGPLAVHFEDKIDYVFSITKLPSGGAAKKISSFKYTLGNINGKENFPLSDHRPLIVDAEW
eukprot:TRINITY_DN6862_c0_g1_i1.p1 TRINITY_DN6862_c0_g1~~TRINITY_DN6862_c0_g1_i1.p1  ORF type:complete len:178 (+),score=41.81 TRINITY_DN6862_c0_g1_i1:78-536(+)